MAVAQPPFSPGENHIELQWYYTINIYGLLKWWNDDPDKVIDMYTYGFF